MVRVSAERKLAVRPMTPEDISGVIALDQTIYGSERALTYSNPIEDYVGGEMELSWVAEVEGHITGFILCQAAEPRLGMPRVAWIGSIGVDPDLRMEGIASKLVDALMKQCQALHLNEVHITADRHDEALEGFLAQMEFRPAEMVHYVRETTE